ncbi:MAG: Crp/Fnr family transcriptional regulator [Chitinophagales bacterium]
MADALKRKLSEFSSLTENEWEQLSSCFHHLSVPRGSFILKEGQICDSVYFVNKGAFRHYFLKDGDEIHTAFSFENSFVANTRSLTEQLPSDQFIVAMENSEVIRMYRTDLFVMYKSIPSFEVIGRQMLQSMIVAQEARTALFMLYTPEERYQKLLSEITEMLKRLPLQQIASYLGIARETLSRIRNRLH